VNNVQPALALEHISKRFGTVQALNEATFVVRRGTVHALLGENGAGKTTLMRVAYGMEAPDRGVVRVHGTVVRLRSPADAIRLGVGMVHQHFTLVPAMTVAENVALGGRGGFNATEIAGRVRELERATGLPMDPYARVGDLSVSDQQRLELLKVLSRNADVLILDEPTAVLPPTEADGLLRQLRQFADSGRAVVLITHKLREALSVADEVTVLRHGVTTLTSKRDQVDEEQLIEAMLGQRRPGFSTTAASRMPGPTVIAAHNVSVTDAHGMLRVRNATFEIRSGEVVGVAAVEGSGHRELLRATARRLAIHSGRLVAPSRVGFVPEDRHRDGLVLRMSLSENFALRDAGAQRGRISWRDVASATREMMTEFDVRAEGEDVPADTLSGGNQQKFILGRELHGFPSALVAENPTRGLDIRATSYVRDRLLYACANGVAIVVHSTDLDELLALASRILVVYSGSVREVPADRDTVGRAMLGAA